MDSNLYLQVIDNLSMLFEAVTELEQVHLLVLDNYKHFHLFSTLFYPSYISLENNYLYGSNNRENIRDKSTSGG